MVKGAQFFMAQAEDCRRQAVDFEGKPEALFLLGIAACFEELAAQSTSQSAKNSIGFFPFESV